MGSGEVSWRNWPRALLTPQGRVSADPGSMTMLRRHLRSPYPLPAGRTPKRALAIDARLAIRDTAPAPVKTTGQLFFRLSRFGNPRATELATLRYDSCDGCSDQGPCRETCRQRESVHRVRG